MRRFGGVLFLGILLAAIPAPAQGQENPQYGLTLGFNWATMQSPNADPGVRTTFAIGGILRRHLYGPVSLQTELLLNRKGAEVESEEGGGIEYGAVYLELPLLIHVVTPSVRSVTVHGEAGSFGALKLFERQTPGGGNLNIPLRTETSFFRRVDAGLAAGVGATIPIRNQRLNLTVRHAWGLVDVARDVGEQPFPEAPFPDSGESRTWSLLLRFGF